MADPMHLHMSLELPRESALVGQTRRTLDGTLAGAGVDQECRDDIQLALGEACANVINHAELATKYHIEVTVEDDTCVIEVTDDGGGFDPAGVQEAGELDDSGRGLRIVSGLVDGLEVVTVDGAGTLLRFSKRLTWQDAAR